MSRFFVLFRREVASTVTSFGFWGLLAIITAITAYSFDSGLRRFDYEMNQALPFVAQWLMWITIVITPLLTMRLFAEEKRSGSFELLMTAPVSDLQVVAAKYLGALSIYLVFLLPVWLFHLILATLFESSPDWGQLSAVTFGMVQFAIILLAMGTLCSTLTSAQLWSALLAIVGNVAITSLGQFRYLATEGTFWQRVFAYCSFDLHRMSSALGFIDLRHAVFALTLTLLILFWTTRIVESRRWS